MRILVVEDEARMARLVYQGLVEEGHTVDLASTAQQARERALTVDYDVVVLDWGLPDEDGLHLLESLRDAGWATPVLMLTARGTAQERVLGLRTGADDYLAKPFDFEEFLARIHALHRRNTAGGARSVTLGDVSFSRSQRGLTCGRETVDLTAREFQVFSALVDRRGDVVTRAELLQKVWGDNFDGEPNVVDVYAGYLRAKLERIQSRRLAIATVRGVGFRLTVKERSE